ncbi:hypothetical protein BHE74_00020071, partial [Ensete ventricosum]
MTSCQSNKGERNREPMEQTEGLRNKLTADSEAIALKPTHPRRSSNAPIHGRETAIQASRACWRRGPLPHCIKVLDGGFRSIWVHLEIGFRERRGPRDERYEEISRTRMAGIPALSSLALVFEIYMDTYFAIKFLV